MKIVQAVSAAALFLTMMASPSMAKYSRRKYGNGRKKNVRSGKNVISVASGDPGTFSTLLGAVQMAGLTRALKRSGPLSE